MSSSKSHAPASWVESSPYPFRMNFSVILALLSRYILLYTRNPVRFFELFFWPIVQLLVWGFVSTSIEKQAGHGLSGFVPSLIGAVILWDALFRSQQGVAISFLEDVWTRNLLNIFAAPVRITEYIAAACSVGIIRVVITALILILIALTAYHFNLLQFHLPLIAWYANLMLFGWTLGIISIALIVKWGHGAESLAWAIPFMIQPFSAVFYRVQDLPMWMQYVANAMPPAHVFEGMRAVMAGMPLDLRGLAIAFGLNVIYLALAAAIFARTLASAREKGNLVKVTSS